MNIEHGSLVLADNILGIEPWVLMLLGTVIVIVVLVRRQAGRGRRPSAPTREHVTDSTTKLQRSMDQLLIELQETAREISASIDTKLVTMNNLIMDADKRIDMLKTLQQAEAKPTEKDEPSADAKGHGGPSHAEEPTHSQPHSVPGHEPQARIAPIEAEPELTEEESARKLLEDTIFRLTDEGRTELEIARETDTPRGEVELILSLRKMPGDDV